MPDPVTKTDLENALDEMAQTWKSKFQEYQERAEEEEKEFGTVFPETKEALDRVQDELDKWDERFEQMQSRRNAQKETQDAVDEVLGKNVEVPGTKDEETYNKYLEKGKRMLTPDERKKLISTDATGAGYLAPPAFSAEVIRDIVEMSPIRELAEVRSTSRSYIQIPRREATGEAKWINEGSTRNEVQNPEYGMERINNHPLHALHLATNEQLEDSVVDIEAAIRNDIAEQIAKSENRAFILGSGAGQPTGILENDDISRVNTGDSSKITADGLIDLHYEIKTPYSDSNNAFWLMDRKTIREIRKLKDSDGDYIWNPGLASDQQPTILEAGYREATDLVAPDSDGTYTTGEEPILFGDYMEGYTISDRVQIAIQRLVEKYSDQGAVGFQARRRVGGQVTKAEAIAVQKVAA